MVCMKVSFITVFYRTPGLIRQLLKGVEAASPSFAYEFFLVDNASGDETIPMVRERFPWAITIASSVNGGFGAGNNLALSRAQGEYVMLLNPDLTVFPGEMEKLVEFADAHPDYAFFGPRLLHPDRTIQRSFHRFPTAMIPLYRRTPLGRTHWGKRAIDNYLMQDANPETWQDVDGLFGSAILIRRSALEIIGNFDERFFMYYEDTDLCRRAWESGYKVCYTPAAVFVHYHQRESEVKRVWQLATNPLVRAHIKSGIRYFLKYRGKKHPRWSA